MKRFINKRVLYLYSGSILLNVTIYLKMAIASKNKEVTTSKKMTMDLSKLKGKEGINLDDFNFMDSKIEIVELNNYLTEEGEDNFKILIQSKILKEGTKLRATEFVSVFKDSEGNLCYSESPKSNARKFLTHFNVKSFDDLKDKTCKVVKKTSDSGKDRLGIFIGR